MDPIAQARLTLAGGVPAALRALEEIAQHGRTAAERKQARRALTAAMVGQAERPR